MYFLMFLVLQSSIASRPTPGTDVGVPQLSDCPPLTARLRLSGLSPFLRYILTSFYTKYDRVHFVVNTISLLTVLIPKLPQLHGVRIFGINKY